MASSLSPNHSVTKAQAPERRVAAETEGNDNGEHAGAQPFPPAPLRVTAWMVSLIGQNFRGQRGNLLPTPVTSVCLCEVGARRQKEDQKKKKYGSVIFSPLIELKMKTFVSTFPLGISSLLFTTVEGFD